MRTRRSLAIMSAVEGSALVRYQGARARWSSTSPGWWPAVAYQSMAMVWQARGDGRGRERGEGGGRGGGGEGGGAVHRGGEAVARLACSEDLLGVLDRDLDGPAGGVALDHRCRGCGQIGGRS